MQNNKNNIVDCLETTTAPKLCMLVIAPRENHKENVSTNTVADETISKAPFELTKTCDRKKNQNICIEKIIHPSLHNGLMLKLH